MKALDERGMKTPRRSQPLPPIHIYNFFQCIWSRGIKELAHWGKKRWEGLVLFGGHAGPIERSALVTTCLIPKKGHWGGGVRLGTDDFISLTTTLRELDLHLLAQMHSHPGDFGHSPGDELLATCFRKGFISIVVPSYAQQDRILPADCYIYEYIGDWKWRLLTKDEVSERIGIIPSLRRF